MYNFKEFKQIEEKVQELINEGERFDEIKNKIIKWIKSASEKEFDVINTIFNKIHSDETRPIVQEVISNKNFLDKDQKFLQGLLEKSNSTLQDKKDFLSALKDESKLIDPNDILGAKKRTTIQSVLPESLTTNDTFQEVKDDIMNYAESGKGARGKGEIFFGLFTANSGSDTEDKGDININGKPVEVKGNKARLRGQKGSFGRPQDGFDILLKSMKRNGLREVPEKGAEWNFTNVNKLNEKLQQIPGDRRDTVINIYKEVFKQLFGKKYEKLIMKYLDKLFNEDGLAVNNSMEILATMQFEYYSLVEDFDGIIFVNVDEGIFQYIRTLDEFKKNINNFHLAHWSWTDNSDRPVFSITLT